MDQNAGDIVRHYTFAPKKKAQKFKGNPVRELRYSLIEEIPAVSNLRGCKKWLN